MKKINLIITVLAIGISSLFAEKLDYSKATLYKADINADQAYQMQKEGVVFLDVRTQREYATSHPKGAINIPAFNDTFAGRVYNQDFIKLVNNKVKNDKNKKIMLICRTGSRTKVASNILAQYGFTNIYNILGGVAYGWYAQKLPTTK